MNLRQEYLTDYDYEAEHEKRDEVSRLFKTQQDAIFALYEQLFCNMNAVCPKTILQAMQFLILCKDMDRQWDEIHQMTPDDVDVVHHRQVDKAVDETTKEFKDKLYNILEDKLF